MGAADPKLPESTSPAESVERAKSSARRRRTPNRGDTPFDRLVREALSSGQLARVTGLRGAANHVAASHLIRAHGDHPVVYVTPHSRASDAASSALSALLGERDDLSRLHVFPRHDTLPFDRFSPQPFLVSQRMEVLHRLDQWSAPSEEREAAPIIVTTRSALALRLPSRTALRGATHRISVGDSLDRDLLVTRLVGVGYQRMALVEEPGEIGRAHV